MTTETVDFASSWSGIGIELDLDYLDELAQSAEVFLESELRRFATETDDRAKGMTEEQKEEWYEWNHDDYWKLTEVFPLKLRSAIFVTIHSSVEHELVHLCDRLYREKKLVLEYSDLAGGGYLQTAQKYLTKVAQIPFPDALLEWKNILYYARVRNAIVHNDGIVKKTDHEIQQFIKANAPHISLDHFYRIRVSKGFSLKVVSDARSFFKALYAKP